MKLSEIVIGEPCRDISCPNNGYLIPIKIIKPGEDENKSRHILVKCNHMVSSNCKFGYIKYCRLSDLVKIKKETTTYNNKIYVVSRTDRVRYDEIRSMVIVERSKQAALKMAIETSWLDWIPDKQYLKVDEVSLNSPAIILKDGLYS